MAQKLLQLKSSNGRESLYFFCPGCKMGHMFIIKAGEPSDPVWEWNGDMEKPTFSPSLGINMQAPEFRCHSFVREGKIQFLSDSYHELAGQTVDLLDVD